MLKRHQLGFSTMGNRRLTVISESLVISLLTGVLAQTPLEY
jgi:hypothetical protein